MIKICLKQGIGSLFSNYGKHEHGFGKCAGRSELSCVGKRLLQSGRPIGRLFYLLHDEPVTRWLQSRSRLWSR